MTQVSAFSAHVGSSTDPVCSSRRRPLAERIATLLACRAAWWLSFIGACTVLLMPLFVVDVPPLLDYPNHLARMFVLAFGQDDPVLSHIYTQHWAIIPNLAIDLVLPELLKVLPIYVAGKVALSVALLLPLVGVVVYHRVAFGVRSFWPLAAAMMAYNAAFILGFMNFLISLGLALLAAAGWMRWRGHYPVTVAILGAVATPAIFFMHIFGLLLLVVLLCGEAADGLWRCRAERSVVFRRLLRDGAMGSVAFLPPVVLSLLAPITSSDAAMIWRPFWLKPQGLLEPFLAYDGAIDRAAGVLFFALLYVCARHHKLRVAQGIGAVLLGLLVLYLICPFGMKGTGFIDARFPIMLGFLVFAGMRPVRLSSFARSAIAGLFVMAFMARTASLASVWHEHNHDVADMRHVIADVSPGSRVLLVSVDPMTLHELPRGRMAPGVYRLDIHLPALLVIERRAFWPLLFTSPNKQPLRVLPPYSRIAVPEGLPPNYSWLANGVPDGGLSFVPYMANWQHDFDYVLMLNPGGAGDLAQFLPDKLQVVAQTDVAALFRIRAPGATQP
jgi:hypothetical protein